MSKRFYVHKNSEIVDEIRRRYPDTPTDQLADDLGLSVYRIYYIAKMTIALDSCGRKREQVDTPTKLIAVATRRLQQYDVPALFLERPLAESLLRSDLPAEMDLRELKLPFPAATFRTTNLRNGSAMQ